MAHLTLDQVIAQADRLPAMPQIVLRILADLAVETGAPVVVHVAAADLAGADERPSLRRLVAAAIGSSEVVVAADEAVAVSLRGGWLAADAEAADGLETWPADADCAARIAAACGRALARRRGE